MSFEGLLGWMSGVRRGSPPRGVKARLRGLTLAEIIVAIGFVGVFTTGLLTIATKGLQASRQDVDIAAAYQYGESLAEGYVLKAKDPSGWATLASVKTPTFPSKTTSTGPSVLDKRFVYTVNLENVAADAKFVTIVVYRADKKKAAQSSPVIDTKAPRGGELLRFVNVLQQEVNNG